MVCVTAKFGIEAFGINAEDAAKLVDTQRPAGVGDSRTRNMNHPIMENLNG